VICDPIFLAQVFRSLGGKGKVKTGHAETVVDGVIETA
jgi:hypothetical protein